MSPLWGSGGVHGRLVPALTAVLARPCAVPAHRMNRRGDHQPALPAGGTGGAGACWHEAGPRRVAAGWAGGETSAPVPDRTIFWILGGEIGCLAALGFCALQKIFRTYSDSARPLKPMEIGQEGTCRG